MRFLKIVLPPIIAFLIFAFLIKHDISRLSLDGLSAIGDGTVGGLIAYYKIFTPVLFVIALLTQYLMIMPLWDKILRARKAVFGIFIGIALVCLIPGIGLSYVIWDKASGIAHLVAIAEFMTKVQFFYWGINFAVLFLLDLKAFFTVKVTERPPDE
jgi:hypothetical protein